MKITYEHEVDALYIRCKETTVIMYPEVRPLTIDGVAHSEPHMSHGVKGKQHASDRGTIWGVKPADNARYLPARTGNGRYPCDLC